MSKTRGHALPHENRRMTVLVVDDERGIRELLCLLLDAEGHRTFGASSGEEALEIVGREKGTIDVVIQDLKMPGMGGIRLLRDLRSMDSSVPVIVITAFSTWDDAVEAMRLGAYNYIRNPFDTDSIRTIVHRALQTRTLLSEGGVDGDTDTNIYREMIGNHTSMHQVFDAIQRIATTDSTVLIQGESGTGKEMVACGIHVQSHRRSRAFVPVNCSAFSDSLLESELFGHRKGAFTGAVADKDGLFQVAEGGTIFLDEVGDMSLSMQVKLLRVLEERKGSSVGSTELTPVDVRIVAATNKVMEDEVRAHNFREDLFYRLNVIPLWLPPLREREEDIPLLVGHFLAKYSLRMQKDVIRISDRALRTLCAHDWPGNVRELENIIQRHVAFCDGEAIEEIEIGSPGSTRRPRCDTGAEATATTATTATTVLIPEDGMELEEELQALERRYLIEALRMTRGHMTRAAKLLGMSYRSIRYRVKKLGIKEEVEV